MPYRVCMGRVFLRGGMVTVLFACLLDGFRAREQAHKHSLNVRVEPGRGSVLATINLHLPPALPAFRRKAIIRDLLPYCALRFSAPS